MPRAPTFQLRAWVIIEIMNINGLDIEDKLSTKMNLNSEISLVAGINLSNEISLSTKYNCKTYRVN